MDVVFNNLFSILICSLLIVMIGLNTLCFADRSVRPVKDHIEDGIGMHADEEYNRKQAKHRKACYVFTIFLCALIGTVKLLTG